MRQHPFFLQNLLRNERLSGSSWSLVVQMTTPCLSVVTGVSLSPSRWLFNLISILRLWLSMIGFRDFFYDTVIGWWHIETTVGGVFFCLLISLMVIKGHWGQWIIDMGVPSFHQSNTKALACVSSDTFTIGQCSVVMLLWLFSQTVKRNTSLQHLFAPLSFGVDEWFRKNVETILIFVPKNSRIIFEKIENVLLSTSVTEKRV